MRSEPMTRARWGDPDQGLVPRQGKVPPAAPRGHTWGVVTWSSFPPRLDIMQALWPLLGEVAGMGFVLYGGTAIALHLGHRQSVDFDFFSERPFDLDQMLRRLPFLGNALVLQDEPDSRTFSLDPTAPDQRPVKLSFFRVATGRVGDPQWTQDGLVLAASMPDLLAHKLKVVLQRLEAKDYLDIHAMVAAGMRLEDGLAGARALFGRSFQPAQALKALTWFQGGDLADLPARVRTSLITTATRVTDLPDPPAVSPDLGGAPR